MPTTRRGLAPARFVLIPAQEGLSGRVGSGGIVDSAKRYGGARGGVVDPSIPPFLHKTLDVLQVNPATEQPRLPYNSGAQPIIRWGFRRFVRTFMTVAPRFYGRWFYAGLVQNQYADRARVTGVPVRLGTTYSTPRFLAGTRVVRLGRQQ